MRKANYVINSLRYADIPETTDEPDEIPLRNYLCRNYDACLNKAAFKNVSFNCGGCRRFTQATKQVLSASELGGMLSLWESVFEAPISIQ